LLIYNSRLVFYQRYLFRILILFVPQTGSRLTAPLSGASPLARRGFAGGFSACDLLFNLDFPQFTISHLTT